MVIISKFFKVINLNQTTILLWAFIIALCATLGSPFFQRSDAFYSMQFMLVSTNFYVSIGVDFINQFTLS